MDVKRAAEQFRDFAAFAASAAARRDDVISSLDVLDLPVEIQRGRWWRKRRLCRGSLRGWRKAMNQDGSLTWLNQRLGAQ